MSCFDNLDLGVISVPDISHNSSICDCLDCYPWEYYRFHLFPNRHAGFQRIGTFVLEDVHHQQFAVLIPDFHGFEIDETVCLQPRHRFFLDASPPFVV